MIDTLQSSDDDAGDNCSVSSQITRDEVKEVRKIIHGDERKIGIWRMVVLLTIVVVSVAVTMMTYNFIRRDEEKNFRSTVSWLRSSRRIMM